ncbi:DUF6443 domain-containing protein [Mucilaginibacter sp. 22184]|uniref:DUF6443 domain-containing protein n=1 Tax=Mucilaginibacter sp. 22184 TaxID=3453887 RepID=UPI003F8449E3
MQSPYKNKTQPYLVLLAILLWAYQTNAQSTTQNYVRTRTPRRAIPTNVKLDALTGNKDSVESVIQYLDGLGRPIQSIQVKGSPSGKDVVAPYTYDAYGREVTKYLPYSATASDGSYKADALTVGGGQAQFYAGPPLGVVSTSSPFSVTNFEPSPLNRVTEQGAPGVSWQPVPNNTTGHTVKTTYISNNATVLTDTSNSRLVVLYTVNINNDQTRTLSRTGNYAAGQLYVTVMRDENNKGTRGGSIEEYKDLEGRVVLKRTFNFVPGSSPSLQFLSTYYVYDDIGNLAFVLPPGANPDNGLSSAANQPVLDNLCYQYRYDQRNRLTEKKLPGKGWEFNVYNSLDQVIFNQDANQRAQNPQIWTYTQYDVQGRVAMTGIWSSAGATGSTGDANISAPSHALKQWLENWASQQTALWVSRDNTTATGYGVLNPQGKILTVNYYDDYNIVNLPSVYNAITLASSMTRSLPTASKTVVLNTINNPTPDMLWNVSYYDDFGRTVRNYKQHYLGGTANTGNFDVVLSSYNFNDQLINANRRHFTGTATPRVTIANQYFYDHLGRKTQTTEQLTNNALAADTKVTLSKIDYNEIGQVWKKNLHSTDNVSFKQTITYGYNERGWLSASSCDQFVLQLSYNGGTTPQYNGNIANQTWLTAGSSVKAYTYRYDQLNRLNFGISTDGFSERSIKYDLLGNISNLSRVYNNTLIDSLTYNYLVGANATNQVQSITDKSIDAGTKGYKSGTFTYSYDGNGNMTIDNSKGISVGYNLLNLPQDIGLGSVPLSTYAYDATGEKLSRLAGTAKTDYIAGIQYDGTAASSTLSFIQTEEGRALPNGTTSYNYEYSLTDNLGNSRVSFDMGTGVVRQVQTDDYLPFGMEISRTVNAAKNEYLYNTKELQENIQLYDYGARFYDPVIARWTSVDPLAEKSRRWTPYNYAENDPIRNIDPDGMDVVYGGGVNGGDLYTGTDAHEKFRSLQQEYNTKTTDPCCEVRPAQVEKSNTFVNEKGELIKKGGKFTSISAFLAYVVVELFSSHDDPAKDLQNAFDNAAKYNFRNADANEGLANELVRNGYGNVRFDEDDDNDTYVYRGGPPSAGTMTPRPSDLDGLSTFTTSAEAKAKLGVPITSKISVNSLRRLGLQVVYRGTHASIRPATAKELAEWAATKAGLQHGGNSHVNTKKVQASVRGIE